MSNEQPDPLWLQKWKQDGIRYLGKQGTGHIDHMDRWQQAFQLGFLEGVKSANEEFSLPENCHIAAIELEEDPE